MRSRTPIRGAAPVRQGRTVKRASARLTRTRIAGGALMAAALVAGVAVCLTPAFGVSKVVVSGNAYTNAAWIEEKADAADGQSLFTLDTRALASRVREIPSISGASITLRLPGTVVVQVTEREPILAWVIGTRRLLVDEDGRIVAEESTEAAAAAASPSPGTSPAASAGASSGPAASSAPEQGSTIPGSQVGASLPAITDTRASAASLVVGSTIDARDLDAATRLASLRPVDVGSTATALSLALNDTDGFTMHGVGSGWTAIFGSYAADARPPSIIPGQVRLLRSLIVGREKTLVRILLADETHGTYTTK